MVGQRLRTLLVRLALDPDRVVLSSQLVDAVWGEDPPAGASNALQSLVSRLRRLLPDLVESHPAGYRLALEPDAIDAVRFETLVLAGRGELGRDPRQAGTTLHEALALWRGPALADLAIGADGTLGAELDELLTAHPLRERLCGLLMRALSRAGRQAEALAAYERLHVVHVRSRPGCVRYGSILDRSPEPAVTCGCRGARTAASR